MFRKMTKPIDISKELENINFKHIRRKEVALETNKEWNNKILELQNVKIEVEPKTQLAVFQSATKLLFSIGKYIGLLPMTGAWDTNSKMSLGVFFRKFLLAIVIGVIQAICVILSVIYLKFSFTTYTFGHCIFYFSSGVNTFLCIYIGAAKLPELLRDLHNLPVHDYFDSSLKIKSYTICVILLTAGLFQHIIFYVEQWRELANISTIDSYSYDVFLQKTYPWFYNLGIGGVRAVGVIIQITNVFTALTGIYSDMFIMCISIYLVSLMKHINKKIIRASDKHYLPPNYWRALREEYSTVTRLVHSFNDVISGIVLISFATTLLFLCMLLYRILSVIKNQRNDIVNNVSGESDSITAKEDSLIPGFSAAILLARTLTVSLLAAAVHSASLVPATALYNVPSSSFSREVARFLNQVRTDTVAISGLQFFYVTRELVLSFVGTIITYELVLLQFGEKE